MIHDYKYLEKKVGDVGEVVAFKGSLITVVGFTSGFLGEGIVLQDDRDGMILSINGEETIIALFSKGAVEPNTKVVRSGSLVEITVGDGLLGHLISPLGYNLDEKKEASVLTESRPLDGKGPTLSHRKKITKFLETGVAVCDLITPLGEGQRELIIGDRKTGKTHFLYQLALSQAKKGKVVIYAFIGKKSSEINRAAAFFKEKGVINNCILVSSAASDSPGEIFITPFSAMTIAEYFRDSGNDSVVILDDMTTHAKYYREISLMAGKFPGRESYPGDVFYTHARLLERAGNFNINGKVSSITAFPVAETFGGDFASYIQTNLASITDGHLYFDSELFLKGIRPAINIFLSVTRVGRQTQTPLLRDAGFYLMSLLKKHSDLERFIKFGTEVTPEVRQTIDVGNKLYNFFNRVGYTVIPVEYSLVVTALIISGRTMVMDNESIQKVIASVKPRMSSFKKFTELVEAVKK